MNEDIIKQNPNALGLVGGNSATASRESAVGSELGRLNKDVSILQDMLFSLGDRLQPVLSPTAPSDPSRDDSPTPPSSDVTNAIARQANEIEKIIRYVSDLKERVEL